MFIYFVYIIQGSYQIMITIMKVDKMLYVFLVSVFSSVTFEKWQVINQHSLFISVVCLHDQLFWYFSGML